MNISSYFFQDFKASCWRLAENSLESFEWPSEVFYRDVDFKSHVSFSSMILTSQASQSIHRFYIQRCPNVFINNPEYLVYHSLLIIIDVENWLLFNFFSSTVFFEVICCWFSFSPFSFLLKLSPYSKNFRPFEMLFSSSFSSVLTVIDSYFSSLSVFFFILNSLTTSRGFILLWCLFLRHFSSMLILLILFSSLFLLSFLVHSQISRYSKSFLILWYYFLQQFSWVFTVVDSYFASLSLFSYILKL